MDCPATNDTVTDHAAVDVNARSDEDGYAGGATEDPSSNALPDTEPVLPDGLNVGNGNTYGTDTHSSMQQVPIDSTYDAFTADGANDVSSKLASKDTAMEESTHSVAFDSTNDGDVGEMGTITDLGSVENGNALTDASGAVAEQQSEEISAISTEEDHLWSMVRTNCLDFNAWTALIQETEKVAEENLMKICRVYDAFLAEFPLCYGYWKKYADHELRLGTVDKVVEVYERAVQAVTYSVDIWLHYCVFSISTYEDPDTIRRLFERGLAYVGTDYLSYPLWDKYIEYEFSQQEWSHLAMIYTRILESPIQQLDRYFNSFKELAGSRPLSELRTTEEVALVGENLDTTCREVEGEIRPDGAEESLRPAVSDLSETEELEKYIAIREEMYKKAKEFDSKIHDFETAIRRPYFHVKPLDDLQLVNWHNYLDLIERGDDFNKVVKLYERCLIACANYTEYWIRYVLCMEASGSMELANNALARATQVFVKRQPDIHLFAARFKEQSGDIAGARAEYQLVHYEIAPGLLEAVIKHANMEYRLGNKEAACSIYEEAITAEQAKEQSQMQSMLFVQYSRFLYLVAGDGEKAREVLDGALQLVQLSKPLLEAVIHLESIQTFPKRVDYLDSVVEKLIISNAENPNGLSVADREELSSIFMEFLDLFGDTRAIKRAGDRHAKLFSHQKSTSESKKRHAQDFLASDKEKLAKSNSAAPVASPAQSVMGAYPNTQNQWAAGYGAQAPQIQGQQWNPTYAQQAGYSGYNSYGSYTNPQQPAAVPPTAAYSAYAQTYPVQAFPQQSYSQPTAAFATAQQAAPVPQAYYGAYY